MSYNESLNINSNYPCMSQSELDNAPWNEETQEELPVEVTVSITLSKTVTIYTDSYDVYSDEEGNLNYEFSDNDLKEKVRDQIILPNEAHNYIQGNTGKGKAAIEDLKDWIVDDLEVIKE